MLSSYSVCRAMVLPASFLVVLFYAIYLVVRNGVITWKIPQGLPDGIKSANKTGETDQDQHDIAIVYGEKTTYCNVQKNPVPRCQIFT